MTEQSETSFANDGRSCQQTSVTQNFVVGSVVVPSDAEDPHLTPHEHDDHIIMIKIWSVSSLSHHTTKIGKQGFTSTYNVCRHLLTLII